MRYDVIYYHLVQQTTIHNIKQNVGLERGGGNHDKERSASEYIVLLSVNWLIAETGMECGKNNDWLNTESRMRRRE